MCTVTLVFSEKNKNDFTLTSNRDEALERKTLAPRKAVYKNVEIFAPVDALAGGSWIGFSKIDRAICLLNGEFKLHARKDHYRKSRGVVLKDFLVTAKLDHDILEYNLDGIEPFTMIIIDWSNNFKIIELVWDSHIRHISNLSRDPQIWSSTPLYTEEMKSMRENWFEEHLKKFPSHAKEMWNFHTKAGIGDKKIDLVMDRKFVRTQSITQIEKVSHQVTMKYLDLKENEILENIFQL